MYDAVCTFNGLVTGVSHGMTVTTSPPPASYIYMYNFVRVVRVSCVLCMNENLFHTISVPLCIDARHMLMKEAIYDFQS